MDKKTRLKRLEELYSAKEVTERFPTREDCIGWSAKVAPLLKSNSILYGKFTASSSLLPLRLSSVTFDPLIDGLIQTVKMAIEELRVDVETGQNDDGEAERPPFINKTRMAELEGLHSGVHDLKRLIRMLEELNICYQKECFIATISLVRAVIDHVPPIFGFKNFGEVANNYKSPQSIKASMQHLENSSRKIADHYLHCHIRKKEALPNITQVNFSAEIDMLLSEIVGLLK